MITDFRLLVFVTVARELSFTRAAEELNVSQPAVTKHIKELERHLSTSLFRRNGNKISLTEAAEKILPMAKSILATYQSLSEAVVTSDDMYSGSLRIGASTTITQYILPEILAKFRRQYPKVAVTLMSSNSENVLKGVAAEVVDIALVEDAHTLSSFHYEVFGYDKIVLVTARKDMGTVTIEKLQTLPLVLRENGSGTLGVVERELSRCDLSRKNLCVEMQIGSSEGIVRYLKSSACFAFISETAVRDYVDRGELYVVDVEDVTIERSFRFASLHGRSSHLVELFIEFCKRYPR